MRIYDIYIDNGEGEKVFYKPDIEELLLIDVKYTASMGSAGSLTFRVPFTHPYFSEIEPIKTLFSLYKNGKKIFCGRFIGKTEDFQRTGSVTCEGILNYLVDSIQDPYEFQGGIIEFLTRILNNHNGMVEERKRFKLGNVTVADGNNYINRSNQEYSTTAEALKEKLVDTHGGYFKIRFEDDGNYLDYVYDYGGINSQTIAFGENLLDISKQIDASKIITCLIPVGANIEDSEQDGVLGKVDISSVNNGIKYIVNEEAVAKYGQIWGTHEWQDVTLPENLLTKARRYLEEVINFPPTIKLNAVDLSLIHEDIEEFQLGHWTKVVSGFHELVGNYMLTEMEIDISSPEKSTITLGGKVTCLSMNTSKQTSEIKRNVSMLLNSTSKEIQRKVDNAINLITGGTGGYVVIEQTENGYPEEILVMDAPDKVNAVNLIRINKNGIGFSNNGYNGTYQNAWTIDGNLVADYITVGSMLADRIKGGSLEVGGTGPAQDGTIVIKDKNDVVKVLLNKEGMTALGATITGSTIQTAETGNRLVMDDTSSMKGYKDDEMVNLVNMSQESASEAQMTIDAKNQLNIRAPKLGVEAASHGQSNSVVKLTKTGTTRVVTNVTKTNRGAYEGNVNIGGRNVYCTLPVFLNVTYADIATTLGMVTTTQTATTSTI